MSPIVKFFLDFCPLAVFFAVYAVADIMTATLALIPVTFAVTLFWYLKTRKLEPIPLLTLAVVSVMGGLTLAIGDEDFIKMKPTIVNTLLGTVLLAGYFRRKMWLRTVLGSAFPLNPEGWMKLTRNYGIFFFTIAILNEIIWRNLPTDDWVTFKVFGILGLTMLFFITQLPLLKKYQEATE